MDKIEFKEQMEKDGCMVRKSMAAGTVNQDHTHPFDARLFVVAGHITLGDGNETTFGPGDICGVDANTKHSEKVNADGCDLSSIIINNPSGEFDILFVFV